MSGVDSMGPGGLAERVRAVRFVPVRLREGYEMGAVDDLLDELVDALGAGRPVRPLVDAARFPLTRLREGYDIAGVDDFLQQLVVDAGEAGPAAPPAPTPTATAPVREPSAGSSTPLPSVVVEQKGLLSRLLGRG